MKDRPDLFKSIYEGISESTEDFELKALDNIFSSIPEEDFKDDEKLILDLEEYIQDLEREMKEHHDKINEEHSNFNRSME